MGMVRVKIPHNSKRNTKRGTRISQKGMRNGGQKPGETMRDETDRQGNGKGKKKHLR